MITLTLPLPTNRANERAHWRTVLKAKHDLWDASTVAPNPKPPRVPIARATLAYHVVHGGALMDWDNLTARLKHAQDWLVNAGYLADDSPQVIPDQPRLTQQGRAKPHERCIRVTITPMGVA